jgi:hypothetical protein
MSFKAPALISSFLKEGIAPGPCLTWKAFTNPGAGFELIAGSNLSHPGNDTYRNTS